MKYKSTLGFLLILILTLYAPLLADAAADAEEMIVSRQFDKAISFLKEKIQKDPSYAELYYLLGKAYYLKGEYDLAERELQNCLDRKRKHEDAQVSLALTYVEKKQWEKAKEILDEGVAKSKTKKGVFLNALGRYHLARGELTEAGIAFRRALIEEPNNLQFKRDLCDLSYDDKVYGVAVECYREILASDSTDVVAHFKLARALFNQQMFGDALKSLSTAIRMDSGYVDAYQYSGDIYMILGLAKNSEGNSNGNGGSTLAEDLFKNAIWMYERFLKLGGKETLDIDYRLGQAYYYVRAYPTAAEYLAKAIATGKAKSNAYILRARSLYRMKKLDEAQSAFTEYETKVTGGDPNYHWTSDDYEFFKERGQTYQQLYEDSKKEGTPDSTLLELAIPDFLKAIELKEKDIDPSLYGRLGSCYFTLKRYQEAIPWFEKRIAADSTNYSAYANLAYCYIGLKNAAKAVELLTKASEINPGQCGPYQSLSNIFLQELKDRKQASTWLAKWAQCDSVTYLPYRGLGYIALTDKPVRKEAGIDYLLKAVRRMEAAGIEPCKDIDIIAMLAQAYAMYEDEAHDQEALKWIRKGLKCDPTNETLKKLKEQLE